MAGLTALWEPAPQAAGCGQQRQQALQSPDASLPSCAPPRPHQCPGGAPTCTSLHRVSSCRVNAQVRPSSSQPVVTSQVLS